MFLKGQPGVADSAVYGVRHDVLDLPRQRGRLPGVPSNSVRPVWPADVARVQVGPGLAYWTVLSGLTLESVRPINH